MRSRVLSPGSRLPLGAVSLLVLTLGLTAARLRADDGKPVPIPADRYNKMAAHSPFAPPTAPVATPPPVAPPPQPLFTDKLTATMVMQNAGIFYATIVDQDTQKHLYVNSKAEDKDSQMQISSVKWNPSAAGGETPTITVRKGTQFGVVRYESGAGGAGVINTAGQPGMPRPLGGMPNGGINRPFVPPTIPGSMPNGVSAPQAAPLNGLIPRGPIRAPQQPQAPATGGRPVVMPGTATSLPVKRPGVVVNDDDDDDE